MKPLGTARLPLNIMKRTVLAFAIMLLSAALFCR